MSKNQIERQKAKEEALYLAQFFALTACIFLYIFIDFRNLIFEGWHANGV